eukprot:scaffold3200_cov106-Skeletonema_marinoi.AAC.20
MNTRYVLDSSRCQADKRDNNNNHPIDYRFTPVLGAYKSIVRTAGAFFACDLDQVQEKQNRDRQIGAQDLLTDRLIIISIVSCDGHMCPSPILPESIDQTPTIMLSVYLGH